MKKYCQILSVVGLGLSSLVLPMKAFAVGAGISFSVQEINVPGTFSNDFRSNSLDFTYHACVRHDTATDTFRERGYFWISSYQSANSVLNSQINYYLDNGYRIYGYYKYDMVPAGGFQPTPTGSRLNYVVNTKGASIQLYLDVDANTQIKISDTCGFSVAKTTDDFKIGYSNTVIQGEKSETNGLASGDFDIAFSKWTFFVTPESPIVPSTQLNYDVLRFNGNVTRLRTFLGTSHFPEGSGNLYWQEKFTPVKAVN